MLTCLFAYFTDEDNIEYDYSGIVYDISSSKNGYTFQIQCDKEDFRCFYSERPLDLGYYKIKGQFSDDGKIFFVEWLKEIGRN